MAASENELTGLHHWTQNRKGSRRERLVLIARTAASKESFHSEGLASRLQEERSSLVNARYAALSTHALAPM